VDYRNSKRFEKSNDLWFVQFAGHSIFSNHLRIVETASHSIFRITCGFYNQQVIKKIECLADCTNYRSFDFSTDYINHKSFEFLNALQIV